MKKTYVLDTSVLIFDPYSWKHFQNSDIIIPIAVLHELDKLKKQLGGAGKHARVAIKILDDISNEGNISQGILLPNEGGIFLKIDTEQYDCTNLGDPTYGDTQILATLIGTVEKYPNNEVTLVSNDINLRVRAKALGYKALSHNSKLFSLSDLYAGHITLINELAGMKLAEEGSLDLTEINLNTELNINECVLFQDHEGHNLSMGRKISDNLIKVLKKNHLPWGISSKNKEQAFAIDLIMDKRIDLVTLIGRAGTGKSLIALASALELVINRQEYDKLVIYRPIQSVGKEMGYLPGTLQEKLAPWFQAILDNLEFLLNTNKRAGDWKKELEMFQRKGRIEMEAVSYIRGRSIPNAILLVDECQNLTPDEIKTILTRAGANTKIILTGDIEQIDNNDLDAFNNGLTHVVESFKNSDIAGHITFTKGERSRLATLASEIL